MLQLTMTTAGFKTRSRRRKEAEGFDFFGGIRLLTSAATLNMNLKATSSCRSLPWGKNLLAFERGELIIVG
jgi:hypothetical protein